MDRKGLEIDGVFDHAVIGIIQCDTNCPAEGWTLFRCVPAGYEVDNEAHNEAINNAESFGYEDCECDDEDCDACSNYRGSMENVCGIFYKYWPSESGNYVNGGDPQKEVINACVEHGGIVVDHEAKTIILNIDVLSKLLYMPGNTRSDDLEYLREGVRYYIEREGDYKTLVL